MITSKKQQRLPQTRYGVLLLTLPLVGFEETRSETRLSVAKKFKIKARILGARGGVREGSTGAGMTPFEKSPVSMTKTRMSGTTPSSRISHSRPALTSSNSPAAGNTKPLSGRGCSHHDPGREESAPARSAAAQPVPSFPALSREETDSLAPWRSGARGL